jgi:hypothetical protein
MDERTIEHPDPDSSSTAATQANPADDPSLEKVGLRAVDTQIGLVRGEPRTELGSAVEALRIRLDEALHRELTPGEEEAIDDLTDALGRLLEQPGWR